MSTTERTANSYFLHLLSAAIWDRTLEAHVFEGIDKTVWKEIANLAYKQSVRALIADKVLSLPAQCLPPSDITLRFISVVEQTKQVNRKMIDLLKELQVEYMREGFPFLLLKGLANGVNYPEPLLRNPGDIDLLLYVKGDYERANEWLTQKGVEIEHGGAVHNIYIRNGIAVENHSHSTYFSNWRYNRRFKRVEKDVLKKGEFATVELDSDFLVPVLPVTFNAFFLFQHLFIHFVNLGVGVRQICDWVLFMHKHRAEIDSDEFTRLATDFALLYPMQLFSRIAVDHLGAPESIFPFPMISNNRHAEMVMHDIMESAWLFVILGAVAAAMLQHFFIKRNFPAYTFPFVVVTWLILLICNKFCGDMLAISIPAVAQASDSLTGGFKSFGQVIFQDKFLAGLLFFLAVFISSPIAALYGLAAAVVSAILAFYLSVPLTEINLGLYGFNAVLCAIVFAGPKVRDGLWVLISIVLALAISLLMLKTGIPKLTFPFVLATWITLLLKNKLAPRIKRGNIS